MRSRQGAGGAYLARPHVLWKLLIAHSDGLLIALNRVVGGDRHFLALLKLHWLATLQHACSNLRALFGGAEVVQLSV
jgi:hypothetical protein